MEKVEIKEPQWKKQPTGWLGLESRYRKKLPEGFDPKVIVELGVDWGWSFFTFADHFPDAFITGIDDFSMHHNALPSVTEDGENYSNVDLVIGDTAKGAEAFNDGTVDLLHIDGDHSAEGVKRDYEAWLPKMAPGSVIMFHDIESMAGPRRFFAELIKDLEPLQWGEITGFNGLGFLYL